MTKDELKRAVARAAFEHVESLLENDTIVGVGTGSTANFFIEELGKISHKLNGTVASSDESARRLQEHNIPVFDLNSVGEVSVYVDGADETNDHLQLIKGVVAHSPGRRSSLPPRKNSFALQMIQSL